MGGLLLRWWFEGTWRDGWQRMVKVKKAYELNQATSQMKTVAQKPLQSQDPTNVMMYQALQAMTTQMEAIEEKISGGPEDNNAGGGNKSRAKCCHPE